MITLAPETEELARRVAERRGSAPEDVVKAGVAIAGTGGPRQEIDIERVREIIREVSSAPLLDQRTPKAILDEAWGIRE